MAMAGLYRRVLPSPPAFDFASHEGKVSYGSLLCSSWNSLFFKRNVDDFDDNKLMGFLGLRCLFACDVVVVRFGFLR